MSSWCWNRYQERVEGIQWGRAQSIGSLTGAYLDLLELTRRIKVTRIPVASGSRMEFRTQMATRPSGWNKDGGAGLARDEKF